MQYESLEPESSSIPKPVFYNRVKTPTVIQMEAIECGAACLGIIFAYYKKYLTLEELRVSCGVSRDGVSALSILKAAEKYGLACEGHSVELEELYDMPLPLIAYWNFDHFVVIEGFSKKHVYINDPAVGPLRISYEELDNSFTGLVLLFEPTPQFQKSGSPPSIVKLLLDRLKDYKTPLGFAVLAGIAIIMPRLALPAFTQIFIDNILIRGIYTWSSWFLFSMGLAICLLVLFYYLQKVILSRLMLKISIDYSSHFLWHIMLLPLSFYNQRYSGEVASRINLNDNIAQVLTKKLTVLVIDVISSVVFGILMFYYDPFLAMFGILMTAANLALLKYLYRTWIDAYAFYQKSIGKSHAYSISSLQSIETIKATSLENKLFSRWVGYYTKTINAYQQISKKEVVSGIVPIFFENLTTILILGFGSWRVINGHLTVGMLIGFKILMQYFMSPVVRLVNSLQTIQLLTVDCNRIDDVLLNPIDKHLQQEKDNNRKLNQYAECPKLKGFLEFRHVVFGFNPLADAVLKDINFSLYPGKTLALVGPSGSGKSTIAKIIGGLAYPWEGEVLLDQTPRSQLPRDVITNSITIVEQEPFLYAASIKENLTCFESISDPNDLIRAAKDAGIHDMIVSRPGGYDSFLESDGANLSGGQRQQFEIARALIRQPSILVLDEATSAVDSDTEKLVFANLRRRGCAMIIIAHRLSTIRFCNEIIVLDKGVIIERGTHEELMAKKGFYKNLNEIEKIETEKIEETLKE